MSTLYPDLVRGSYDCVDRIVLNAYFRLGHSPGGFRYWWQRLTGSDETLDNTHLMRMAGRFSRRVRGWAQAHQVPVIDCSVGDRKHEIAEQQLEKTKGTQGIFLILVSRAQAPVWEVRPRHHLERKRPMPYVNHYSFHLLDPDWGHVTIKISGHPPFPAQVILNGHEYVGCQARQAGIHFVKEGNCFTHVSDAAGLAQLADTLLQPGAIGQLGQVCDRWIYTACLCFALDLEQQKHSGFHYDYSIYQLEYSRNLIFEVGHHMDQVFQALIDRSRAPLNLKTVKTILGTRHRPRYRARKKRAAEWEVAVERPVYDLTIFKLHCGKLTLKCYTKGERVLRMEAMVHNTQQLDCGRSLAKFPFIVSKLKGILDRFQQALSCIDQCFIADQTLEQLVAPTRVGQSRVGGIDFNKPRMRWVAEAVLALATNAAGFSATELACQVRNLGGPAASSYARHQASYDLKKLRGKQIVQRLPHKQRYRPLPPGLKTLAALLVLRDKIIRPLLAGSLETRPPRGAQNPTRVDHHYETLRLGMQGLFHELGIAA